MQRRGGGIGLAELDVRGPQLLKQPVRESVLLVRGLLGKCREGEEAMDWSSLMYVEPRFSSSGVQGCELFRTLNMTVWYFTCLI